MKNKNKLANRSVLINPKERLKRIMTKFICMTLS